MAYTATRGGPSTIPASDGSRTITVLDSQPREEGGESGSRDPSSNELGRLTLRGGRTRPRVVWAEDTVDNEGAGKKSSKSEFYSDIDVRVLLLMYADTN